jgi:hypothetical protein
MRRQDGSKPKGETMNRRDFFRSLFGIAAGGALNPEYVLQPVGDYSPERARELAREFGEMMKAGKCIVISTNWTIEKVK